jgi:hypothetical protein
MTDAAAIAGKLTKAQKYHFERSGFVGGDWCVFYVGTKATMNALITKGLVERRVGIANRLTPLGLAVRQHLQQQERQNDDR